MKKNILTLIFTVLIAVFAQAQQEVFYNGNDAVTVDIGRTIDEYYEDGLENGWSFILPIVECGAKKYGNPKAEYMYGLALINGWNTNKDYPNGMSWLKKSADQGEAEAACELGSYYLDEGRTQDAEKYLLLASRKPSQMANYNLGLFYQMANKSDLAEKYYLLAIQNGPKGQVEAIHNLTIIYSWQDRFADIINISRIGAYTYNYPYSQFQLGFLLYRMGSSFDGNPTPKDKQEALSVLRKAAAAGEQDAVNFLSEINQ